MSKVASGVRYFVVIGHFVLYAAILAYVLIYLRHTELNVEEDDIKELEFQLKINIPGVTGAILFRGLNCTLELWNLTGWGNFVPGHIESLFDCNLNMDERNISTLFSQSQPNSTTNLTVTMSYSELADKDVSEFPRIEFTSYDAGHYLYPVHPYPCDGTVDQCSFRFLDRFKTSVAIPADGNMNGLPGKLSVFEEVYRTSSGDSVRFSAAFNRAFDPRLIYELSPSVLRTVSLEVVYELREVVYLSVLLVLVTVEFIVELYLHCRTSSEGDHPQVERPPPSRMEPVLDSDPISEPLLYNHDGIRLTRRANVES